MMARSKQWVDYFTDYTDAAVMTWWQHSLRSEVTAVSTGQPLVWAPVTEAGRQLRTDTGVATQCGDGEGGRRVLQPLTTDGGSLHYTSETWSSCIKYLTQSFEINLVFFLHFNKIFCRLKYTTHVDIDMFNWDGIKSASHHADQF